MVALQVTALRQRQGSREMVSTLLYPIYCRFENFLENFIFVNNVKRLISDVKNSQLRQDLPISIYDKVVLPFRESLLSILNF